MSKNFCHSTYTVIDLICNNIFLRFSMEIQQFLDQILLWTETPSQYIGGECNSVKKDLSSMRSTLCLSFPDTYPIGMSYHGLKLLYEIVNREEDMACERAFAPLPDFIEHLKKYDVPLFSLESRKPIRSFHFWGFSIATEIYWTNVLEMLSLARVPVWASQRTEEDPIVIAGGHGVYNPEPGAPFMDIIAFGDGEEMLVALMRLDAELREQKMSRQERIIEICKRIPGLYAPNYYDVHYNQDGTIAEITPQHGLPEVIQAQFIQDIDKIRVVKPLVGYNATVHNRIFLEIMRGCTRGCRFCQAGIIRRPLRLRSVDSLVEDAVQIYKNTGYDEIALYSLASSDYPYLEELTNKLLEIFAPKGVGLSLPSLRINEQLKMLPKIVASVRKCGLTLAPEVGSEKMQKIINKCISQEEMLSAVSNAYSQGWNAVKLYCILGLPFQGEEDHSAIIEMLYQVSQSRKKIHGYPGNVSASISNFVPKSHTPFQWAPMAREEELRAAQKKIKQAIRSPKIELHFHDANFSILEGMIARGNRKMANVIYSAWQNGAYMDEWNEHFKKSAWDKAFAEHNLSPEPILHREIPLEEKLPWYHIRTGVSSDFLAKEWKKAASQETTPHCSTGKCNNCGIDARFCARLQGISSSQI